MSTYVLVYFGCDRDPVDDHVSIFNVTKRKYKDLYINKYHPEKNWTKWYDTVQTLKSLREWESEAKRGEWYASTVRILDVWEE